MPTAVRQTPQKSLTPASLKQVNRKLEAHLWLPLPASVRTLVTNFVRSALRDSAPEDSPRILAFGFLLCHHQALGLIGAKPSGPPLRWAAAVAAAIYPDSE